MSRAVFSAFLAVAALSMAPVAAQADPRRPVMSVQGPVAASMARPARSDALLPPDRRPVVLTQPTSRFYTEPVWRSEVIVVRETRAETPARPIRMRSGNPVEPGAVVSRTPSGRVVVGLPPGAFVPAPLALVEGSAPRPYAPPQFHIIGAPSGRHMGSPVKLTYGVKPPETLRTGPKVVWLDQAGGDDAGGRVKRLR